MMLYKLYLFIFIYCLNISYLHCQDTCEEKFIFAYGEGIVGTVDPIDDSTLSLGVTVPEAIAVGSILYNITWVDSADFSTNSDDINSALEYVAYSNTSSDLSVYVEHSMLGIVDYDRNATERQESLLLDFYFLFANITPECQIEIRHYIQDNNTQAPHLEEQTYYISVREDYPINMNFCDEQFIAYDFDADSPNNEFSVDTGVGCPLEASGTTFTCTEGAPVIIELFMTDTLNYDTMESPYSIICTVTLSDMGNPPLMSSSSINITVTPFVDENPVFGLEYYHGYLTDTLADSVVQIDPQIEATDADVPPSLNIVYNMTAADSTVGGDEYFAINGSGVVFVTQDLDNEILVWGQVSFILSACDEDEQCAKSFLTIDLPVLSGLEFEKVSYAAQVVSPAKGEVVLQVHAQSSNNQSLVRYSMDNVYFGIDAITGEISPLAANTPAGDYTIDTFADDGTMTAKTTVNIEILPQASFEVIVTESVAYASVGENNNATDVYTVTADGSTNLYFCILNIQPESFSQYFDINEEGTVFTTQALDAENLNQWATIKAAAYLESTTCPSSPITSSLLRNEVLIQVEIVDANDNQPYFVDPAGNVVDDILYAYPEEVSLQKAIGPIATVLGKDADVDSTLIYTLLPYPDYPSDGYEIDSSFGDIYLTGELQSTIFYVQASDGLNFKQVIVHIDILSLDYISSVYFSNLSPSRVEAKILEISAQAGVNVYLLYSNLIQDGSTQKIEAQVYSTHNLQLANWERLKSDLSSANVDADVTTFSDESYFVEEKSFKTATIVLGCLCGLLVLVGIIFLVILCRGKRGKGSKNISTLGKAYANEDFRDDFNEPSFATIFGNNPVNGKILNDERRESTTATSKRGSAGSQIPSTSYERRISNLSSGRKGKIPSSYERRVSSVSSGSVSGAQIPPSISYERRISSTSSGTSSSSNNAGPLSETAANVITAEVHHIETKPVVYPSLNSQLLEKYEEEKQDEEGKKEYEEKDSKNEEHSSSFVASAPTIEVLEMDSENESVSGDKKSNLKVSSESNEEYTEEEPKSVAFKVLVDTVEFEPDSRL